MSIAATDAPETTWELTTTAEDSSSALSYLTTNIDTATEAVVEHTTTEFELSATTTTPLVTTTVALTVTTAVLVTSATERTSTAAYPTTAVASPAATAASTTEVQSRPTTEILQFSTATTVSPVSSESSFSRLVQQGNHTQLQA